MSVNIVLSVLTILLVKITILCVASTIAFEGYKKCQNPFFFIRSTKDSMIENGINKNLNNSGSNNILNTSETPKIRGKKWQVGRVSRKHFEIVNMLWRKTNMFFDVEITTEPYYQRRENDSRKITYDPLVQEQHTVLPSPILPASTPSFIEFYYLDETDGTRDLTSPKYVKHYAKNNEDRKIKGDSRYKSNINNGDIRLALLKPVFAFHVNNPFYKRSALPTRYMRPTNRIHQRKLRTFGTALVDLKSFSSLTPLYKFPHKLKTQYVASSTVISNSTEKNALYMTDRRLNSFATENSIDNETCAPTEILNTINKSEATTNTIYETQPSTVYDKIKFFEMYDRNTHDPNFDFRKSFKTYDIEAVANMNVLNDNHKNLLEHVDQSIGHDRNVYNTKHAKKHIIENNKDGGLDHETLIQKKILLKSVIFNPINKTTVKITQEPLKGVTETVTKLPKFHRQNVSTFATWSEYSFAAVYVYEPLQVHCDAAGISQHWLITAGSCLYHHHKKPVGTGRSAFVAYCGEAWWNPGRIAYVKYTVVHPRYHSRDITRRHLYNVGLIQVVTSMASACTGWAPIPFMSHQLISDKGGSTGTAIGWGLDRFDTRYPLTDLPMSPLSLYESRVFSDSCPGNFKYSKAKRLDDDGGIKNVYCLALPPYLSEENDPVHGTLLLVGGKLIALYLEEERRPWGEQCAQYTGTWRLIPWVLNVAHEADEADSFVADNEFD